MRETRREILPGVHMTCLQTDKFKTGLLSVNLLTPLSWETASKNALIPSVLRRGTVTCPDMDAMAARLDGLYGARLEPAVRKKGEIQCVGFWADFVDEAWLPKGESLLEQVAALMGEVLLQPNTRGGLLLPQYVDIEKEKLLEDIRARVNDKISYSRYRMTELMCPAENYAVDVLGTEEEAEAIGYVALTRHYRALLASSPMEVFYCGTADPDRAERAMRDALETLPRGELDMGLETVVRVDTLVGQPRFFTEEMDVTQGKVAIGYRLGAAAMNDPDMAALRVMNAVFGGGVSSKLFVNVREKLGLCYFASSAVDLMKGVMAVISGIEVKDFNRVLAEISSQLYAVRVGDITDEELHAAKVGLVNDLLSAADSAGALESFWLEQNLMDLEYGPEELAALVEDVTVEDVVKAAADIDCDVVYFLRGSEEDEDAQN